jgi:hypothetical protein
MSAGAWSVVVAVVAVMGVATTAFGAWFTARAGRTASPYDALASRVTALEQQRAADVLLIEAQQTEIVGLQRRVAGMIEDRDALVSYVVVFREWVAGGSRPPAPTNPRHLADVLPAWVLADGAEAPKP